MTNRASGTFEVKVTPIATDETPEGPNLGRLSIEKQFHGDLEGVSRGEMLTAAGKRVASSAGYVAVERIVGVLQGKKGTFALQHMGVMTRGTGELSITIVPDSGTGQLAGVAGKATIRIEGGQHFYDIDYTLAPTA